MPFSDLNAPSAALRICVNRAEPGRLSGLVYGQRLTAPMPFSDLGALLLQLDEVLEVQNFPQAFQRYRRFGQKPSGVPAAATPEAGLSADAVNAAQGEAFTFVLQILSRRNSSWQGTLDWLDDSAPQEFASALELMRMIEERPLASQHSV